jgi:hypothetical protein
MDEEKYEEIYSDALFFMDPAMGIDLEPTSAFKQAASDAGIPAGDEMGKFVTWARERYAPGAWD